MKVDIIEKEQFFVAGVDYFGPLPSTEDDINPIEELWERFTDFCSNRWYTIKEFVVDEDVSYEIHMWNQEELEENRNFIAFIGVEVDDLNNLPVELVGKVISESRYAKINLKGDEIQRWEELVYKEWLESSDYQVRLFGNYSLDYQRYDEKVFKGIDNLADSELDVFLPIEEYVID
ncbi:MAG: GyrI-like domain-containing protein [Thermoplasmatota archaeon]